MNLSPDWAPALREAGFDAIHWLNPDPEPDLPASDILQLPMLTRYIHSAMSRATYEILEDRTFFGEIPGFSGVYANADTLEGCREELQEVLEDWIVLGLRLGHKLPVVDDIRLGVGEPVG